MLPIKILDSSSGIEFESSIFILIFLSNKFFNQIELIFVWRKQKCHIYFGGLLHDAFLIGKRMKTIFTVVSTNARGADATEGKVVGGNV